MTGRFDAFVVFAEMRTGSNFLETNLNAFDGITCHGEAFNPHFIGYPNRDALLDVTLDQREADPMILLQRLLAPSPQMHGFRYFHDHDPRVLDAVLDNPRCAKIILTRNPAESYVSWKIARSTGQWKLTDVKRRKAARAVFDAAEFETHLEDLQQFQIMLLNRLQTSGQTAFYLDYEDLQSVEVMNGLARFLGVDAQLDRLDKSLKVQNPAPLAQKVENFPQMASALAGLDRFNLTRTPNFEPRRVPAVPTYVACPTAPLLHLPIKGGPLAQVTTWMAAVEGCGHGDLQTGLSQKELRQWKRKHRGHRSFTVLRHPVARAHHVFCSYILGEGPRVYGAIRRTLVKRYGLDVPEAGVDDSYDLARHRGAFLTFIRFLAANLAGQTAVRVDAAWCTQAQAVQGFAAVASPDLILRETDLARDLPALAKRVRIKSPPAVPERAVDTPFDLAAIYDEEIEKAVAQAYQRDYVTFGFRRWA